MKKFIRIPLLGLMLSLLGAASALAAVITFENSTGPVPYSEAGFDVTANGPNGIFAPDGVGGVNDNGTNIFAWCGEGCGGLQTITVSRTGGGLFDFLAIDASNMVPGLLDGNTIDVTGYFSGGGSITQNLTLVLDTWTTYVLSGFTGLTHVEITKSDSLVDGLSDPAIDNLQLRASDVPEPAPLALLGLGLIALGAARKRKG